VGVVSAGNTPAGHYSRVLPNGLVVASAEAAHADQLEALQRVVFPTLADDERFKAAHYRKHLELFPEGQFVGLDGDRVVAGAGLRFAVNDAWWLYGDVEVQTILPRTVVGSDLDLGNGTYRLTLVNLGAHVQRRF